MRALSCPKIIVDGRQAEDLRGRVFNRLTVESLGERDRQGRLQWKSRCTCGNVVVCRRDHLTSGNTQSCGCLQYEMFVRRITTHGMSGGRRGRIPEYIVWNNMHQRCFNPDNPRWPHYGGRGISVCDRWQSFSAFLADMGRRPGKEYQIERKDNNSGYSPDNCIWATSHKQTRNTRRNLFLSFAGRTMCLTDWASEMSLRPGCIRKRLALGWPIGDALTLPAKQAGPHWEQSKLKIGAAHRGRQLTIRHRAKLRASWLRRKGGQ